ncbi:MAG TPA: tyrosine-type recombinase/integrase [Longimicrobiales bacterium]|nr:tyrosine-type recombinase/integrase [Longimicrobiales bacterium]
MQAHHPWWLDIPLHHIGLPGRAGHQGDEGHECDRRTTRPRQHERPLLVPDLAGEGNLRLDAEWGQRGTGQASGGSVPRHEGRPISSTHYRTWRKVTAEIGLEGSWFHDLRRSAVRRLERAGVSRSVAMKLTGHKTESVYRRYTIADSKALEEGVEKLARFAENAPGGGRKTLPMRKARSS